MHNKIFKTCLLCFMLLFITHTVSAKVYTTDSFGNKGECVYIMGNENFYPIEYYNEETKQYDGIMPKILESVSFYTEKDFVYIHEKDSFKLDELKNLPVEMISAYVTEGEADFIKDVVTIFTYTYEGKMVNVGWAFTDMADDSLIEELKKQAENITEEEINGYLLLNSYSEYYDRALLKFIIVLFSIFLIVFLALVLFKLRKTKKQINENIMTDAETGIGNYMYFNHCFKNITSELSKNIYYIAYIIIDSNYIQLYHGETTFTDTVKYTADVLRSYSEENGISARITENGFVFVFKSNSKEDAQYMIEKITEELSLYMQEDTDSKATFFHMAMYNLNALDYNSELLLFNLRKKCNKLMGTDTRLVICNSDMVNNAVEEKYFIDSITKGFENQEFKMYLQFIVDNKTKKIVSAEALSRWDNPEKGLLGPGEYIKVMESAGLITELDYYMFEMACRQLHKWKDTEFDKLTISCNFTRITISEDIFLDRIKQISGKYMFEKSRLIMEITEDAIEKNFENAMNNIINCKKMGFKIALDDIGSGYTSLINICDYPIDIVKIDRDILLKTDKKNGKELFNGIIALAHSLNLKVVSEGVETEEQAALVEHSECDLVQGFYYSRVFSCSEAETFAREYAENI